MFRAAFKKSIVYAIGAGLILISPALLLMNWGIGDIKKMKPFGRK